MYTQAALLNLLPVDSLLFQTTYGPIKAALLELPVPLPKHSHTLVHIRLTDLTIRKPKDPCLGLREVIPQLDDPRSAIRVEQEKISPLTHGLCQSHEGHKTGS